MCGLLIAASCKKDEPVKEKTYYDFVLEDYTTLATRYPEARDHFVETRFVLNKPISEAGADELKAEAMQTICYAWLEGASRIFTMTRDFTTGETQMDYYSVDTPWVGGKVVGPDAIGDVMSVEDALYAMKMSNVTDADTPYATLCWPTAPALEHPQYAFRGDKTPTVYVDAVTGDVVLKP